MNADLIIFNGSVFTADDANSEADSVVVKGNKIVFVGPFETAKTYQNPDTKMIDAAGKTVMPGFIDTHFHVLWGSRSLASAQLIECKNLDDLKGCLLDWAEAHPNREWVMGNGMSYAVPSADIDLNRHHLDAIIADRPVILFSFDMHTVWLNTLGLEKTGLLNGHPPLPGDADVVMGDDGLATGALVEPAAYNLAVEQLPEQTAAEKLDELKNGMAYIASHGITTVHDMACNAEDMQVYGALHEQGGLTARIYANQLIEPEHKVADIQRLAVPLRDKYNSDLLRVGFIKFFIDGVYESFSAVTLNGYPGRPDHHGEPIFSADHFAQLAAEADRLGFQIAVHACGDGGVQLVLNGYESVIKQNGRRDSRHRVEHIEMVSQADIGRFKELGVIASMQPLHAPIEAGDSDVWVSRVAEEEWDMAFAWRSIRDAGVHICFGSDWPVVPLNPFLSIHAALNRKPWKPGHNSHNQTLTETLISYTRDAAFVEFSETKKGQLKAGMLADIAILSDNIFEVDKDKIATMSIDLTIMNGNIVFQKNR